VFAWSLAGTTPPRASVPPDARRRRLLRRKILELGYATHTHENLGARGDGASDGGMAHELPAFPARQPRLIYLKLRMIGERSRLFAGSGRGRALPRILQTSRKDEEVQGRLLNSFYNGMGDLLIKSTVANRRPLFYR
jgi:hypothetical protein